MIEKKKYNNKESISILFITNFGKEKFLGFGHFFRCLNISDYLNKKKYEIYFKTSKKLPNSIKKEYTFIKQTSNKNNFDYIFCDLPDANHVSFKSYIYKKLIIIDEFNTFKRKIKADIIKSTFLKNFIFLKFANQLNKKKFNKKKKKKKKIDCLVSFGGSDYYNLNIKIFHYLLKNNLESFLFVKKLIGKNKIPKKYLVKNYMNIFKTYNFKLFIGSGGNTMFEMISNKIPCLVLPTNRIEKKYINYLRKKYRVGILNTRLSLYDQYKEVVKNKIFLVNKNKIINQYEKLFK